MSDLITTSTTEDAAASLPKPGDFITPEWLATRPLSYSSLKAFRRSPLHYVDYILSPRERTPALAFGGLVDCLVLTPELYEGRYVVMPKFDMRKKEDKAACAAFMEANHGKDFIFQDQLDRATLCKEALFNNPKSAEYLNLVTTTQRKIKWTDKETGIPMVSYIDLDMTEPLDIAGDLKTGKDVSPDEFQRAAYNFGYHIQAATYLEAFRRSLYRFPKFVFITVESEPPFGVAVYDKVSPSFLKLGLQELEDLRRQFKYCMDNKLFEQSYNFKSVDGGHILELPGYAKQKINE